MKKFLLIVLISLMTGYQFTATAADHTVQVIDDQFVPSVLNIQVGDRVIWERQPSVAMPHNVTSSFATSQDFTASNPTFSFTFNDIGTFGYYCSYHGTLTSGMRGQITVSPVTSIGADKGKQALMEVYPNPARESIMVKLDVNSPKTYQLSLINLVGQTVTVFSEADVRAGTTDGVKLELNNLPAGYYFLRLIANDKIMDTRRLLLHK